MISDCSVVQIVVLSLWSRSSASKDVGALSVEHSLLLTLVDVLGAQGTRREQGTALQIILKKPGVDKDAIRSLQTNDTAVRYRTGRPTFSLNSTPHKVFCVLIRSGE